MKVILIILGVFSLQFGFSQGIFDANNTFEMSLILRKNLREVSFIKKNNIKQRITYKVDCYGKGFKLGLDDTSMYIVEKFDTTGLLISTTFGEYPLDPEKKPNITYTYDEKGMLQQMILTGDENQILNGTMTNNLIFDTDSIISSLKTRIQFKLDKKDTTVTLRYTINKSEKNYLIYTEDPFKERPGPDTTRLDMFGRMVYYADAFGYQRTTWEFTEDVYENFKESIIIKKTEDLPNELNDETKTKIDSTITIEVFNPHYHQNIEKTFIEGSFYHNFYTRSSAYYHYSEVGLLMKVVYKYSSGRCKKVELYNYTFYEE